eukprot:3360326-Karenia_brevis.AAC.1
MASLKAEALAATLQLSSVDGCSAQQVARLVAGVEVEQNTLTRQWVEFGMGVLRTQNMLVHDTNHDGHCGFSSILAPQYGFVQPPAKA